MLERPVSVGNGLEKKFRLSLSINPLRGLFVLRGACFTFLTYTYRGQFGGSVFILLISDQSPLYCFVWVEMGLERLTCFWYGF